MLNGNSSVSATCYRYLVPSSQLSQYPSLIHTLLPADADSNSFATGTAGEYFLATENPSSGDTSDQLAFWTWTMITNESSQINVSVNTFTPGCYDSTSLENTFCVPSLDSSINPLDLVDGLGDRLMSRLAYRNLAVPCSPRTICGEMLAVTQTTAVSSSNAFGQTQVQYYTFANPSQSTGPTVEYQGEFVDTSSSSLFYFMPSNAIDANGNVGYTFTGSSAAVLPALYLDTLDPTGTPGTATVVPGRSFTGSENDENTTPDHNQYWGEYVSTTIDPSNDLKFWSIGGYYETDQVGCTSSASPAWSGCNWYTTIFSCTKGGTNCP
jgi:hypothetical protein